MSDQAAKYKPHRKQRFRGGRVAEHVIEALGRELEVPVAGLRVVSPGTDDRVVLRSPGRRRAT